MSFDELVLHRFDYLSRMARPGVLSRDTTFQFRIRDPRLRAGPVSLYLVAGPAHASMSAGEAECPDCTIDIEYELWQQLQSGTIGLLRVVREMIRRDRVRVDGDRKLFSKLNVLFGGSLDNTQYTACEEGVVGSTRKPGRWRAPERILIVSCSGRPKNESSMYRFAALFAEGCAAAPQKPTVDLVHLADYRFAPCRGCFGCWGTKGRCVLNDDFTRQLRFLLEQAPLVVFSFPLYVFNTPPLMNAFLSRMFSYVHPRAEWRADIRSVNHYLWKRPGSSVYAIGGCGYLDRRQFGAAAAQLKTMCRRKAMTFRGMLLRTLASAFTMPVARSSAMERVEDAFRAAGAQLAEHGHVSRRQRKGAEAPVMTDARLRAAFCAYQDYLEGAMTYAEPPDAFPFTPSPYDTCEEEHPREHIRPNQSGHDAAD